MNRREDGRPDPEALIRKISQPEAPGTLRGRLRIYLAAAPGAGKTYAMLHEGKRRKARGTDVVVGLVETHNRPLTLDALEGLEIVPRRRILYQGIEVEEMDVDAILARKPAVALVDELAHTNVPGSRNEKRWQDVQELLAAGITVISTLNIQHLESLNDIVATITGIRVRETVPDRVVDEADEIEVVDISPEALRSRMRHGNIYPREQAERALEGFFRPGNLAALRELVLKRAAQEVEQHLHSYMKEHDLAGWGASERILVLLDDTPGSEVLVRRAWRLAHAFNGELIAAYPAALVKGQVPVHILTVAQDLNARMVEIPGDDVVSELGAVIERENITHVTLAAPKQPARFIGRRSTLADALIARFPHLELHLVRA